MNMYKPENINRNCMEGKRNFSSVIKNTQHLTLQLPYSGVLACGKVL